MKIQKITFDGLEVFKIRNDIYGNERFVIEYFYLDNDYEKALKKARILGMQKYKGCDIIGFVFKSDNLKESIKKYKRWKI